MAGPPERLAQQFGHPVKVIGVGIGIGVCEIKVVHSVDGYDMQVSVGYLEPGDHQSDPKWGEQLLLRPADGAGHRHTVGCRVR